MLHEEERIRLAYKKRHSDGVVYSLFNSGQLFWSQQLERKLIELLQHHGVHELKDKKILEVGCGTARLLRAFIDLGAKPENMSGIDLRRNALEAARRINPNIDFRCQNAEILPFENQTFDIVMQSAMFTSILNDQMKKNSAGEMLRVLKATGIILWYDYFVSKPTNRDVKGVGKSEIIKLFPKCIFDFNRVTLAPPIARILAPHSFLLCYLLEKIPFLRTHYLVVIKKKTT